MDFKSLTLSLVRLFILSLKDIWGVFNTPYKTYRTLSFKENLSRTILIFLIVLFYFAWASLLRTKSLNPLFLSFNFAKLCLGAFFTFLLVVLSIYFLGKLFGGKGSLKSVFTTWAFSLFPTLCWFSLTSIFYLLLPPPRTTSFLGVLFSLFYLAFSASLFFWKGLLYFLTLRFSLKIDLLRIILISAFLFPLGVLYSILMYKLRIFRVPFI